MLRHSPDELVPANRLLQRHSMRLVTHAGPPVVHTLIHGGSGEGSQASKRAHVAALTALPVYSNDCIFWAAKVQ